MGISCDECGEELEQVEEGTVSGFVGMICTNPDCVVD